MGAGESFVSGLSGDSVFGVWTGWKNNFSVVRLAMENY